MGPLLFQPVLKRTRWGGRRLGTILNKSLDQGSDFAESWEVCDHGPDQSVVLNGPHAGQTLHSLMVEHSRELLGNQHHFSQFPLLVKFLDAHDRLSVQVHPNDQQAAKLVPRSQNIPVSGKSEAWVILATEPGSRVYVGLQEHVDRTLLEAKLRAGKIEECLHEIEVTAGDVVFVPAGTVHAVGEGVLFAEVQQTSDITFRLHDWNRLDQFGQPRPLHIPQALECIDFSRGPVSLQEPKCFSDHSGRGELLVACEHFILQRRTIDQPISLPAEEHFQILMVLEGEGELVESSHPNGVPVPLTIGQTVLLPAIREEFRIVPNRHLTLLSIFAP